MRSLPPLMKFKRGDHICVVYRDEDTLLETLALYIADGMRKGERCFCAQKPHMVPRLLKELELLGVDAAQETRRGVLEVRPENEFYFSSGRFEPQT